MRVKIPGNIHTLLKDSAEKKGVSMSALVRSVVSDMPDIPDDNDGECINTSLLLGEEEIRKIDGLARWLNSNRQAAIVFIISRYVRGAEDQRPIDES